MSGRSIAAELLGEIDEHTAHDWTEQAVGRCLQDRGQEYRPVPFDPTADVEAGAGASLAHRRASGFDISIRDVSITPLHDDPNARRLERLTGSARQSAIDHANDCRAEVEQRQRSRRDAYVRSLSVADAHVFDELASGRHPAIRAAIGQWQACMRATGWPVASLDALMRDLEALWRVVRSRAPAERAAFEERERQAAVADWSCTRQRIQPVHDRLIHLLGRRLERYGVRSLYEQP
ncbi:MAG: hypothetical protein JWN46_1174 [Acidimicrobiales bacterium]|nr:hypothetical protein [Acidimicrobiales bacterium]